MTSPPPPPSSCYVRPQKMLDDEMNVADTTRPRRQQSIKVILSPGITRHGHLPEEITEWVSFGFGSVCRKAFNIIKGNGERE